MSGGGLSRAAVASLGSKSPSDRSQLGKGCCWLAGVKEEWALRTGSGASRGASCRAVAALAEILIGTLRV